MKKYSLVAILFILIGCSQTPSEYGLGGKNACQFIKEQVQECHDDIQDIEVVAEDSLLCDLGMTFGDITLSKQGSAFLNGEISKEELSATIDSIAMAATDVENSWRFSNIVNDSLKMLSKYDGIWRKVYTIKINFKSGITKDFRVLMDTDGITPRMIERDMEKAIEEHTKHILEVQTYLLEY